MIATGVLANGSIEAHVTGTTTLHGPTAGTMRGTASSSNNQVEKWEAAPVEAARTYCDHDA